MSIPEHIDAKIDRRDPEGCWPWTGCTNRDGYGVSSIMKRKVLAHRVVLEDALGRTLSPGECALHSCDNPPCCNPEHLTPGTQRENLRDRDRKGRQRTCGAAPGRTGLRGVIRRPGGFQARIWRDGKQESLGTYDTPEEAHAVYLDAQKEKYAPNL